MPKRGGQALTWVPDAVDWKHEGDHRHPLALYRRVKARAALDGRSVRDVTIEFYARWLDSEPSPAHPSGGAMEACLARWEALGEQVQHAATDPRPTSQVTPTRVAERSPSMHPRGRTRCGSPPRGGQHVGHDRSRAPGLGVKGGWRPARPQLGWPVSWSDWRRGRAPMYSSPRQARPVIAALIPT